MGAFVTYLVQMIVKMILVGAVALCGIRLGKFLRDRKDAKTTAEKE